MRHFSVLLFTLILATAGLAQGAVRRIRGESASPLPPSVTATRFVQRHAATFGWNADQLKAACR